MSVSSTVNRLSASTQICSTSAPSALYEALYSLLNTSASTIHSEHHSTDSTVTLGHRHHMSMLEALYQHLHSAPDTSNITAQLGLQH